MDCILFYHFYFIEPGVTSRVLAAVKPHKKAGVWPHMRPAFVTACEKTIAEQARFIRL